MNKITKKLTSIVLITGLLLSSATFAETTKEEWVYVNLESDGQVEEIIVNSWLHSDEKITVLNDISILDNIKNIKSDEKPEIKENNITWNVKDHDIYYQGTTTKELPFGIKITYIFNGEEVSPEDILSKSGDLEIHILNTNNYKVEVDNKDINLPISIVSIVNLPNEIFKNVEINTGKLVNDGDRQIVTYLSMPGLEENLTTFDLEKKINISKELVIKSVVENFEMNSIYLTATTELPDINDFKDIDKVDEFTDGIIELSDASDKLLSGSKKLNDGFTTLNSKLGEFTSGIELVNNGVKPLKNGALVISNGASQLEKAQNQIVEGIKKSTIAIKQLKAGKEKELAFTKMAYEGLNGIEAAFTNILKSVGKEEVSKPYLSGLNDIILGLEAANKGGAEFLYGLESLEKGLMDIEKGANIVKNKLSDMSTGATQLSNGLVKLEGGVSQLVDGSKKLSSGSNDLSNGMNSLVVNLEKFNDEGINKLSDNVLNMTSGLSEINLLKDDLEEVSKSYKSYSGISDDAKGSVKFILKTEEIKIEKKEVVTEEVIKEEKGFINWLKDLF